MSIPTSLIVVVLVLAWLVVLVPMVARRREAVPEAEMAGGTFRVLQRSGDGTRRRAGFRRPTSSDASDRNADEQVAGDGDMDGHELDERELDQELLDDEYADGSDEYGSDEYEVDEYDEFDGEQSEPPAEQMVPLPSARFGGRRSSGSHPYQPERSSSGSHPYRPADRQQPPVESRRFAEPTYQSESNWQGTDLTSYDDPSSYDDDAADERASSASNGMAAAQHIDDMHLRPIPRRAGRGGYDPDAAEVARQFKYSRRRRVTVVLLLATLLCVAAAILINPVMWAGTAIFGLLLVGYLAYLRRQVQIEANIRERRLARLRRARQIRPEYDQHAESFVTGGRVPRGVVPASQMPSTGFRRGRQIVDLDDDDPAFEDLEYYQPVAYRRASGQ